MLDKFIKLSIDKAREIYSFDELNRIYEYLHKKKSELVKMCPYQNTDGEVLMVDGHFDDGVEPVVLSFWFTGDNVKIAGAPNAIFGEYGAVKHPTKPLLVVGNSHIATVVGEALDNFAVISWRGGPGKVLKHEWKILKDRPVFIFPTDDKAGIKAALKIKGMAQNAIVVKPYEPARKMKEKGSTCIDYLNVLTPAELTEYILENPLDVKKDRATSKDIPFSIMGRSGENDTYFIDRSGWMIGAPHGAYNKAFCLRLAPMEWWKFESGFANEKTRNIYWDDVLCWLIGASNKDFDPSTIRGRGAWKNAQGDLCFNNGRRIWGSVDKNCHYLKKPALDIDLDHRTASLDERKAVLAATVKLRFETEMDAIRALAWATLAPFGGALPWRAAALITGSSGSGKSTVIDYIVKPLACSLTVSGGESTEAGVRQAISTDSRAVVIEEAEKDTKKKAGRRDDLFSLMRQSTSNDAPIVAKGTQDGRGMSFQLRSMFMFAAISPEVAQIADDNRIFKLNLKSPKSKDVGDWGTLKAELVSSITPEVCAGIRSFVWQNFRMIVSFAEKLSEMIQNMTGRSSRYALAEGLFLSCYYIVYRGHTTDTTEELKGEIEKFMKQAPKDEARDDAIEMLERIQDESVFVSSEKGHRTLGELCRLVGEGREYIEQDGEHRNLLPGDMKDYRAIIGRHGLTVSKNGDLCIARHHHRIAEITNSTRGYHLTLMRMDIPMEDGKACKFAGEVKRALILKDFYTIQDAKEVPDEGSVGDDY